MSAANGKLTAFISGPITGVENFKRVFDEAAAALEAAGYEPVNPTNFPPMMDWGDAMIACLSAMRCADILVDLPGWDGSKGSHIEHLFAEGTGKLTVSLAEALAAARQAE